MKTLSMLVIMCAILPAACGKKNESKLIDNVFHEELLGHPEDFADNVQEVVMILKQEAQRSNLAMYHGTKWYNRQGQFLCKSIVMDGTTFKIER